MAMPAWEIVLFTGGNLRGNLQYLTVHMDVVVSVAAAVARGPTMQMSEAIPFMEKPKNIDSSMAGD